METDSLFAGGQHLLECMWMARTASTAAWKQQCMTMTIVHHAGRASCDEYSPRNIVTTVRRANTSYQLQQLSIINLIIELCKRRKKYTNSNTSVAEHFIKPTTSSPN